MPFVRYERRRGFQPPWYTVVVYTCDNPDCDEETTVRARNTGPGAIVCPHCEKGLVRL